MKIDTIVIEDKHNLSFKEIEELALDIARERYGDDVKVELTLSFDNFIHFNVVLLNDI